jgi:hypothetical protein
MTSTEVEVKFVIVLLLATALAAAGVVGTAVTLRKDGYRQIPTELRF